jgi:MFS family permease
MTVHRNVPLLAGAQALYWVGQVIAIIVAALVGQMLAPHRLLATLPLACITLGNIAVTRTLSRIMQERGRRAGFTLGSLAGLIGGALNVAAIAWGSFPLFCVGCAVLGLYQASAQYYRLAATDSVDAASRGRAVSLVLAGSIVAAIVGKPVADWAKDLVPSLSFAGSYLIFSACALGTLLLFPLMRFAPPSPAVKAGTAPAGRPMSEILRLPLFRTALANAAIGQGIMVMVMQSTPLAIAASGHHVTAGSWVIQWHVLGMFVPSFFTGRLIDRHGAALVALGGVAAFAASGIVATIGTGFFDFLISSCLLGIGWNFTYIAGTTQITASHRPEERGRVQGTAEFTIACVGAGASFAAGSLLHLVGWTAVNVGILPLIVVAGFMNLALLRRQRSTALPAPA